MNGSADKPKFVESRLPEKLKNMKREHKRKQEILLQVSQQRKSGSYLPLTELSESKEMKNQRKSKQIDNMTSSLISLIKEHLE